MQTLNNIPADSRLTRWFAPIYEAYSVKTFPARLDIPQRLRACLNIAHRAARLAPLSGKDKPLTLSMPRKGESGQGPKMFVAFSGGKDCLAAAIRAEQDGYEPTLVHIRGINMSLVSEHKHAQAIARAVGYPYIELKINFSGKKEFNEHPLRNLLILCLLIDEGVKQGCMTYSLGNIFEDATSHANIDYDLSDGIDMLRAWERFMKGIFSPEFKLKTYVCNNLQSYYTIWRRDKTLLPLLTTCCTPDFRKPMIRQANVKKYGESVLSKTGCGGCYKCATEYMYRVKFGLIKASPVYDRRAMELIAKFKSIHKDNFAFDTRRYNRYGGTDTEEVQVLCDRIGYYIGRLEYDPKLFKWFTRDFYGHKHYRSREEAQAVLVRFVKLYKLK
nr:MAG TPA: putative subunit of tRNA(5-methylaminomethyl-2-thiouridylate) methyltransferase [Caudoviricetes sp.]